MLMLKKVIEIVDQNEFISFLSFRLYRTYSFTLNLERNELLIRRELKNLRGMYNCTYIHTHIQLLYSLSH